MIARYLQKLVNLMSFPTRYLLSPLVSLLIMPSQTKQTRPNIHTDFFDPKEKMSGRFFNVPSTNGAKINFCEIMQESNAAIKNQKIIIHAHGNYGIYEDHFAEYIRDAKKYPNCRIVGFNCRNVQASKGRVSSEEDYVDDVIAVVNHYRQLGVPLENILLRGESLGAAILTMAAAKIYRQEKEKNKEQAKSVKLLNCRSFSNLVEVVIVLVLKKLGSGLLSGIIYGTLAAALAHYTAIIFMSPLVLGLIIGSSLLGSAFIYDKLPKALIRPWLTALLWLSFGTMDALSKFKELPADAKDYIMVKEDDLIITPSGLHDGLKPIRTLEKQRIREELKKTPYSTKSKNTFRHKLRNIKDCKLKALERDFENDISYSSTHTAPLEFLLTYHNQRTKKQQISGAKVVENKIKGLLKIGPIDVWLHSSRGAGKLSPLN